MTSSFTEHSISWNDQVAVDDDSPKLVNQSSTGEILAETRKKLNLTTRDIAESLYLSEKIIHSIEKSDFSSLPGTAYATGYVRSYATHLNLDADELIANDPQLGFVSKALLNPYVYNPNGTVELKSGARWLTLIVRMAVVGIAIAACAIVWVQRDTITSLWNDIMQKDDTPVILTTPNIDSGKPTGSILLENLRNS